MSIEDKLKALYELRRRKQDLKQDLECLGSTIEMAQEEIVDEFESRQIKSMKLEDIGNFVMKTSSYPRVNDHASLHEWLEKQGIDKEVILAFNQQKFRGFYNELLEQGKDLPPGTETFTKSSISITKGA